MIDMHVHASERADLALDQALSQRDATAVVTDAARRLSGAGATGALMILMDERFQTNPALLTALPRSAAGVRLNYCQLLDFRHGEGVEALRSLADAGASAVKFHPYLQRISRADLSRVERAAAAAGELGMLVVVDGEYGSERFFEIAPAEVMFTAARASRGPVIFAHAGGAAVLDAVVLAEACPNIFLDVSFVLTYWRGSTVEQDIAFGIRRLGAGRWMYGSDAPFVPLEDSARTFEEFCGRFDISAADRSAILSGTAESVLRDVERPAG